MKLQNMFKKTTVRKCRQDFFGNVISAARPSSPRM